MGLSSFKKRDYKVLKLSIVGVPAKINPNSIFIPTSGDTFPPFNYFVSYGVLLLINALYIAIGFKLKRGKLF